MSKSSPLNTLVAALGFTLATTLASVPIANAQANPFGMPALSDGYRVAADSTAPAPADTAKGNAMPEGMSPAGNMNTNTGQRCPNMAKAGGGYGMKMMDTNGDGKITKEEFMKRHEEMFANMDANHDGVLDKDEISKMMGGMHGMGKYCPRKDQPIK